MSDNPLGDKVSEYSSDLNSYISNALLNTLSGYPSFKLPPQVVKSLDILPKLKPDGLPEASATPGASSRSDTTLFAVLNKCRTQTGQRLLAIWLQNPLKSKEKIDLRQEIVEYLTSNAQLRTMCYDDYLRKVPDLIKIAFRISKEKCSLTDLVKVYFCRKSTITLCKDFVQVVALSFQPAPDSVTKLFRFLEESSDELDDFSRLIEESIDLDNIDELGEYMVKPESDEDVARVSIEISSLCSQARRLLSDAADETGLEANKTIKLETDAEKGFGFKVTRQNEQSVRGIKEFEQLSCVKKDGYRFTNRALNKISTKYVDAKREYQSLAKNIIHDIISKAVMYDDQVLDFSMALTMIDVFVALSVAAIQNNYIKPLILEAEDGKICIDGLRHPCIELQPDVENYVPNDINMNKADKSFYLITGPNMGGKSTYIKSVAICVIMAQCGSMIPAEDARVSIIDGVFTRVGAGDRQMDGISTFMEEMMDMSEILKAATRDSFVIIDELGRGTSTFDGFGLAYSISKHLATETRCYALFATHYHELTEMEEEVRSVGNLHVKAVCQDDKLIMLYSIGKGVCDESYGINVAQFTKFPENVIESAKEKLKQFEEVPGFSDKKEVRSFVRECTSEFITDSSMV